MIGDELYVATWDAGEGNDHFIYLALTPGPLQNANWAKAGQIAAWDAYLADENDNDYVSWFDASAATQAATGPNGGVLEGTINLAQQSGSVPSAIHLAVGPYPSADGSSLLWEYQVPASINSDGNLDAGEYLLVDLDALFGEACPGDLDNSGDVGFDDLNVLLAHYGGSGTSADGDLDGDADVDFDDLNQLLAVYGQACP